MLRDPNYNPMIEEGIIPKEEAASWNHDEVCYIISKHKYIHLGILEVTQISQEPVSWRLIPKSRSCTVYLCDLLLIIIISSDPTALFCAYHNIYDKHFIWIGSNATCTQFM